MGEQLIKPPIDPCFATAEPNSAIDLGQFDAVLGDSPGRQVTANLLLRFLPKASIRIDIPANDSVLCRVSRNSSDKDPLTLTSLGVSFNVYRLSHTIYEPDRTPIQLRSMTSSISRATFHLFNWPKFYGPGAYGLRTGTAPNYGGKTCGRSTMEFGGWKVVIVEVADADNLIEQLKQSGGFAITHVGTIERSQGEAFSTLELDDVIESLTMLFSFALGRWSSPSLTVGFDDTGEIVFQHFGLGFVDSDAWSGGLCIFDSHHSEILPELMDGFWTRWTDVTWKRAFRSAIYWYLGANKPGSGANIDSGILFTQTALELLAWTYCVIDKKIATKNQFGLGGFSAARKLNLLASELQIPTAIPNQLIGLLGPNSKKWTDGMHAITDIRNGLVHPSKQSVTAGEVYFDAWRLSHWYIEMCLLALCGYKGSYSNRLVERLAGQIEPVPWST